MGLVKSLATDTRLHIPLSGIILILSERINRRAREARREMVRQAHHPEQSRGTIRYKNKKLGVLCELGGEKSYNFESSIYAAK
jgi:hypothetical protein